MQLMCEVLGASTSGFYAWLSRTPSASDLTRLKIMREIIDIFMDSKNTYGSPRVYRELLRRGYAKSCDTIARYMQQLGLRSVTKKRFKVKTTNSNHSFAVCENLLQQEFTAHKPDEVWLSDLTYIETADGWLYLVTVMDLFSRKIIGWNLSATLEAEGTIAALQMAIKARNPPPGLIFHSDRGVQYACKEFRRVVEKYGIVQSMSRRGNCYDNAPMESFFHTFKTEHVYQMDFSSMTLSQAAASAFYWIEQFYNRKRSHSSIGYISPVAKEEQHVLASAA